MIQVYVTSSKSWLTTVLLILSNCFSEPSDLLCIAIDPFTQARTSFATISLFHSPSN